MLTGISGYPVVMLEGVAERPALLVTGLSGAGKSVALKALEDVGYEVVDNLPLSLLDVLLGSTSRDSRLAIGIDVRTRAFDPAMILPLIGGRELRPDSAGISPRRVRLLFLDCAGNVLVRRFSETRRRHPLARDRPASDGIAMEREILAPLRPVADMVIDTTDFSPNDLRNFIVTRFAGGGTQKMTITVMSFGFARGIPRDADTVLDVRFLANPHWDDALRPLTGEDPRVQQHVFADPACSPATEAIMNLLLLLLPRYHAEGRAYMTLAVGCTGGRHRSVAVATALSQRLAAAGWENSLVHRDAHRLPEGAIGAGQTMKGSA